ncbi:hypothetical protein TrST_g12668 [Triparma strigata]|uniref:PH domain-containing protein n=1 Tax=Triparma strigata TaxID=1606541 RepID=A0A9W7BVP6_9STRA|nr:hypothetical protein TrST_g12668 [Triparma strigata]
MSRAFAALPIFGDDLASKEEEENPHALGSSPPLPSSLLNSPPDRGIREGSFTSASPPPENLPEGVDRDAFQHFSNSELIKCGWMEKDTVRKNILGIFPNAGRHLESWKRRWFMLYADGTVVYYRYRDAVDMDDLWSPAGGEVFFDDRDNEREKDNRRDTVLSVGTKKVLELRNSYVMTKASQCKRHTYHSKKNVLSVQIDASTEMLVSSESSSEADQWLAVFNGVIDKLLETSIKSRTISGFKALGDYVSLKIDLNKSMSMAEDSDEEEPLDDPSAVNIGAGLSDDQDFVLVEETVKMAAIPPPSLSILIMVVGTRGDVGPFVAMGKRLKTMGHRVRIATHSMYRKTVTDADLLFYPLGGDPIKLSGYMVKTHGKLIPNLLDRQEIREHAEDIPEKLAMLEEICESTWPACTEPDPEDPQKEQFVAEAIISNPVTYGHSHCAEKLGIPLHMFFPQPWTPTKAFPHVFSSMDQGRGWSKENEWSYYAVDQFFWLGTESFVNKFRDETLELPRLLRGELGGHRLNTLRVPFCYMFSPALVAKPKDWPNHTDIVGNFFAAGKSTYENPELESFLAADVQNPPIFVGFGSMVIEDPGALAATIAAAAKATNTRIVLQSSWSKLAVDDDDSKLIFCIGNCPHDWLFTRMAGVVHHGGAGTVAAGLRASKPTLVCPFFGDQFFWGEVVNRAGVGPKPIPAQEITSERLALAFTQLKSDEMKAKAVKMAEAFEKEDGVGDGIAAFHKQLPIEDMVCDVSLFLPNAHKEKNPSTLPACRWCPECQMKLSLEVDAAIHAEGSPRAHHERTKYLPVDWGTKDGPSNAINGFAQGIFSFGQEAIGGFFGVFAEPIKGGAKGGAKGFVGGVGKGIKNLVLRPLRGGVILLDKTSAGLATHISKQTGDSKTPFGRYFVYDKLHQVGLKVEKAVLGFGQSGQEEIKTKSVTAKDAQTSKDTLDKLNPDYISDILQAYEIATQCREVFAKSEQARLNGLPSNANPLMLRTLTNAITESRRGGSKDHREQDERSSERNSSNTNTVANTSSSEVPDANIQVIFESYFGVKGGRMQFSEFVGQFLFSDTRSS